jgi:hypothetical protein
MLEGNALIKKFRSTLSARASEGTVPGPHRRPGEILSGEQITAKDDAFHFGLYKDHTHRLFYVEWWYYNFQDPVTGLTGMVTFAICNPGNEYDLGTASLNFAMFKSNGDVVTKIDFAHVTHFSANPDNANVSIGHNTVQCESADVYHINAASSDGEVAMDLTFKKVGASQLLANNVPGYAAWEVSSWLVYMPSAKVTGQITIGAEKFQLTDAKGYHDHDWGMWMLPERIWSWAQFSSENHKMAFDVGFHAAFQKSTAYMKWQDHELYFPQDQFQVTQTEWTHWWAFWSYPERTKFQATDSTGKFRLELDWKVKGTSTLWKYPLLVFEQSCDFTGVLSELQPDTNWKVVETIAEAGFCEFTDRWVGGHDEG